MIVQQKGKHTFIDKIHVRYFEKEKRPWARMENFNSSRIAINERYYQSENDRIFEGGIWAECTVAHNEVDDDDYAFYIEELRPIQLSKFDFGVFVEGRKQFSRDEWIDVFIRSFGLEPSWMSKRLKFHYLAYLFSLSWNRTTISSSSGLVVTGSPTPLASFRLLRNATRGTNIGCNALLERPAEAGRRYRLLGCSCVR